MSFLVKNSRLCVKLNCHTMKEEDNCNFLWVHASYDIFECGRKWNLCGMSNLYLIKLDSFMFSYEKKEISFFDAENRNLVRAVIIWYFNKIAADLSQAKCEGHTQRLTKTNFTVSSECCWNWNIEKIRDLI